MSAPMTGQDLLAQTVQQLGRTTMTWSVPEIVTNGINPAQRLLTLLDPSLLTRRAVVSVLTNDAFIDLRQVAPRCIAIRRIVLGTVATEVPARSLGSVRQLEPTTRESLAWREGWWRLPGVPTHWYPHGRMAIGLWRRAAMPLTLTLIYAALPTPFDPALLGAVSDLPVIWHPVVSNLAAAMLLIKEGQVEAQRGFQQLGATLQAEAFAPVRRMMARVFRDHGGVPTPSAAPAPQAQPAEVSA